MDPISQDTRAFYQDEQKIYKGLKKATYQGLSINWLSKNKAVGCKIGDDGLIFDKDGVTRIVDLMQVKNKWTISYISHKIKWTFFPSSKKRYDDRMHLLAKHLVLSSKSEKEQEHSLSHVSKSHETLSRSLDQDAFNGDQFFDLALRYKDEGNVPEFVENIQKAVSFGNLEALYYLGQMHSQGYGVSKDLVKAINLFEKAAEQGHGESIWELGHIYFKQGNCERSIFYLNKLADQNNPKAIYRLAFVYKEIKNITLYYEYLKKAADLKHPPAAYELADSYMRVFQIQPAMQYFHLAAAGGLRDAQSTLGILYAEGKWVSKNENRSKLYLNAAARRGCPMARSYLEMDKVEVEVDCVLNIPK